MGFHIKYSIRRILIFIVGISLIISLSSCQTGQASVPTRKPDWHVILQISGGLKGVRQEIIVSHTGRAEFNEPLQRRKTGKISADTLHNIAVLVKKHSKTIIKSKMTAKCRDCYYYVINVQYDGITTRHRANDIEMDEQLRELVRAMRKAATQISQVNK